MFVKPAQIFQSTIVQAFHVSIAKEDIGPFAMDKIDFEVGGIRGAVNAAVDLIPLGAFRKYSQYSPMHYLLNVRLNHASTLLRTTDASITDIAFDSGFRDSNYFSMIFHRQFGMTPREFRNRDKKGITEIQ